MGLAWHVVPKGVEHFSVYYYELKGLHLNSCNTLCHFLYFDGESAMGGYVDTWFDQWDQWLVQWLWLEAASFTATSVHIHIPFKWYQGFQPFTHISIFFKPAHSNSNNGLIGSLLDIMKIEQCKSKIWCFTTQKNTTLHKKVQFCVRKQQYRDIRNSIAIAF